MEFLKEIKVKPQDQVQEHFPLMVRGHFEEEDLTGAMAAINTELHGALELAKTNGEFTGKLNSILVLYTPKNELAERLLVIGLGKRGDFNTDKLRQAAATAIRTAHGMKIKHVATEFLARDVVSSDDAQYMAEGYAMGSYRFTPYQSKKDDDFAGVESVTVISSADIKAAVEYGYNISAGVNLTRDLGNHPGNVATPTYLAETAEKIGKAKNFQVTIFDRDDFKRLGMGGIAGVSAGTDEPPKFIIMEYQGGGKESKTLGLVGKGLTFDSGGISIKPAAGMDEMKFDMLGGAAVLGIMHIVARLQPKLNIIAIVPSTENMNGDRAMRPGDILKAYNGKTIEVLNTDAEGRLILADGLSYLTENYEVDGLVDFATLTGAVVVALGHYYSGVLTNHQDFANELIQCGEESSDRVWQFPLDEDYANDIKSKIADVKNMGKAKEAGTIAAAAFLQEFVKEGTKWCHVDI
ncbi:MAG: leucyl aminopeptidase, partial [Candidatus Marinimicrobia bacterium]|nr:leucyl aminopeptidase [Candidatus Neomarinimicrobiota bacterium]MCF7840580.1 leucyl aminopeptidase [Candidatus Neomarinimicrobiota bacterium]